MAKYTPLDDNDIATIGALFDLHPNQADHLPFGHANTSYLLRCEEGDFVATVLNNHQRVPPRRLVALLRHLGAHGARVAPPLDSRNGEAVETIHGQPFMVKPYVEGTSHAVMPVELLGDVGAALAGVHEVPVPEWLGAESPRMHFVRRPLPAFPDPDFGSWLEDRIAETRPLFQAGLPHGMTHMDLFPDNVVVPAAEDPWVLDWEGAGDEILLIDIAVALVAQCRDSSGPYDRDRAGRFLAGYESRRALTPPERELLDTAIVFAATSIAYLRYVRHHILFPEPQHQHLYREMFAFLDDFRAPGPGPSSEPSVVPRRGLPHGTRQQGTRGTRPGAA